jgi:hypothetical protein
MTAPPENALACEARINELELQNTDLKRQVTELRAAVCTLMEPDMLRILRTPVRSREGCDALDPPPCAPRPPDGVGSEGRSRRRPRRRRGSPARGGCRSPSGVPSRSGPCRSFAAGCPVNCQSAVMSTRL